MKEYIQKPDDKVKVSFYPSGKTCEEIYEKDGKPANGWSRKVFFENGDVWIEECFSHDIVIEQIEYKEDGTLESHMIYSHAKKKLIDKPTWVPPTRPNVVTGCSPMGFFLDKMPAIAEFIGAVYSEEEFLKRYDEAVDAVAERESSDGPASTDDDEDVSLKIAGPEMKFGIWFDPHEIVFQWHLWAKSEEQYEKAKEFMEGLRQQARS